MSASVTAATTSSAAKAHKKTPVSTPTVTAEHQPRPSKLTSMNENLTQDKTIYPKLDDLTMTMLRCKFILKFIFTLIESPENLLFDKVINVKSMT